MSADQGGSISLTGDSLQCLQTVKLGKPQPVPPRRLTGGGVSATPGNKQHCLLVAQTKKCSDWCQSRLPGTETAYIQCLTPKLLLRNFFEDRISVIFYRDVIFPFGEPYEYLWTDSLALWSLFWFYLCLIIECLYLRIYNYTNSMPKSKINAQDTYSKE